MITKRWSASGAEIDAAQRNFDFLIPFQHKKLLTTDEVARCLGREVDFVRQLVEAGKLEAHQDSAFGKRLSNRITRRSVAVHLARTATRDPSIFVETVIDLVTQLSSTDRERLLKVLQILKK